MKLFTHPTKAIDYAREGGQALHVFPAYKEPRAPAVFKQYREWGHLIDQNKERLIKTARWLGVRVIKVDREGNRGQHIDLCGKPLERAKALCEAERE